MLLRLIGEDIDLAWRPGKEVWPVKMDPIQVDQILTNLCVNARDAIVDTGKLTIETSIASFDEEYCSHHAGIVPGDYVLLAVSDTGCGMDKETQAHLFEPFFTTKEMGKGTGLGLATVYGVVKQNNGFINVYSEPRKGTTFKIYLPRHLDKTVPLPEKEPYKPDERGRETVLLVEDEPDPMLTCRIPEGSNPKRIVVDSKLRIPLTAKVLNQEDDTLTIVATTANASKEKVQILKDMGIKVLIIPEYKNKVDLEALIIKLGEINIDSILLEGGSTLNYSALEQRIVDKVQFYIAPKLIGGENSKTPVGGAGVQNLSEAFKLYNLSTKQIGEDILIEGYLKP